MNARRLVFAAALSVLVSVSAPAAFAGGSGGEPWDSPPPSSLVADVLDAAVAGLNAALTVL